MLLTLKDKNFLNSLIKLSLPIMINQLFLSSLNLIDVMMIGQLGDIPIAAVGISNQLFHLFSFMLFGICSGSTIFTSQYWGKKDLANIKKILGICLCFSLSSGLIFSLLAVFFPHLILNLYTSDQKVIKAGLDYLPIVGLSYLVTAVTFSYSSILRSMEKVILPTVISLSALFLNSFLNYCLIFGVFGFPRLGIKGAAIATCLARFLECSGLISIIYLKKTALAAQFRELFSFHFSLIKQFCQISLPAVLSEISWALGISAYGLVYARISTNSVAAVNIASTVEGLAFVLFIGINNAASIMIGNKIGTKHYEKAYRYAQSILLLVTLGAVLVGLILFLSADFILSFYKITELTRQYAFKLINIISLFLAVKALNLNLLGGILRSGGDTRYVLVLDSGSIWLVGVPIAFITAFVFHLSVYWVMLFIMAEEVLKVFIAFYRFKSRKWINNLTV